MTDYVISAVKYKDNNLYEGKELYSVKVHTFNNTTKHPFSTKPYEWKREQLIGAMLEGKKFNTYYKDPNTKEMKLGASIEIYELNGQKFIKTEHNNIEHDNLSELPEF
jgi:hypothetical protein